MVCLHCADVLKIDSIENSPHNCTYVLQGNDYDICVRVVEVTVELQSLRQAYLLDKIDFNFSHLHLKQKIKQNFYVISCALSIDFYLMMFNNISLLL